MAGELTIQIAESDSRDNRPNRANIEELIKLYPELEVILEELHVLRADKHMAQDDIDQHKYDLEEALDAANMLQNQVDDLELDLKEAKRKLEELL